MRTAENPTRPERGRRMGAVLASLLGGPGLGHFTIGYFGRAAAWYGTYLLTWALALAFAAFGHPRAMWVAIAALVTIYVLIAPIDTLRLAPASVFPKWRHVVPAVLSSLLLFEHGISRMVRRAVKPFEIPTASMYPTLHIGDHVMVTKGVRLMQGDVAVFSYPQDPSIQYVQRIVAVGGDSVEFVDGVLSVNGRRATRRRADLNCAPFPGLTSCTVWWETVEARSHLVTQYGHPSPYNLPLLRVPMGHVYVLGDHRENSSSDSRVLGTVPEEMLFGKATFVLWSSDENGPRWGRINASID
jgi:signal peptidase I